MLHLRTSNRTERLLDALVRDLGRWRSQESPLEPVHLVLPNRNVETFVRLGIARETGIAANLRAGFLERFLARLVEDSLPGARLVDRAVLEGRILALLYDEALLAHPELTPVREYLYAAGAHANAVDLRRSELAAELSRLFDEYALSRPEMLAGWRQDRPAGGPSDFAATARWQQRLWREAHAGLARIHGGTRWLSIDALWDQVRAEDLKTPRHLHVFGISYFARSYQRALWEISRVTDLYIYSLCPCEERWDDTAPPRSTEDPFALLDPSEPAPLRLWGRPGREAARLLHALPGSRLERRFEDPGGETVLWRLQRDILRRAEPLAPRGDADASLRLLACPGVRREAETIAAEIWRLLSEDEHRPPGQPRLRLCDIAVVVPEPALDTYRPHIAAVFREMGDLPHSIVDLPLAADDRAPQAFLALLDLPLSRFTRRDVLRVLVHPAVIARFPEASAAEWVRWCQALGIVYGADREDHQGTYVERDLLSWDQGARRLGLGAFLAGAPSGDDRLFEAGGEQYLPEELAPDRRPSAASFALCARSLLADARWARDARLTVDGWQAFFGALLASYVGAPDGGDDEGLARCRRAIQSLGDYELCDLPLSYRVPCELVRRALGARKGSRGQYLAEGVAVSSFLPMRALPFRVIFAAGLGEGQFPAHDRRGGLDLRGWERFPGDVSRRERDLYLFLETLLCARDRLYLSYVARDELTGEPLEPSSAVIELLQILREGYLLPGAADGLRERFPLRRHEDPRCRAASAAARGEWTAAALAEDLRSVAGDALPGIEAVRASLPGEERSALDEHLAVTPLPPAPPTLPEAPAISLSTTALRRFLECPMQGFARYRLRMREEEDDEGTEVEDELFSTPRPAGMRLLREVFLRWLREGGGPEAHYDEVAPRRVQRAELPTGLFGAADRAAHLEILLRWRSFLGEGHPAPRVVRFGRAEEHTEVEALRPALAIHLGDVKVELSGRTEPLLGRASLLLALRSGDGVRDERDFLRAFLDHVVLTALGEAPAAHEALLVNGHPRDGALRRATFAAVSREEALVLLQDLARDLLTETHAYLLPCEAVFKHRGAEGRSILDLVDALRESPRPSYSSLFGPVPDPGRFDPPREETAREMIRRRFGLYFERLQP